MITPREASYRFKLLLENRTIEIYAYNLETVLAEKMETIITRGILNTRMRDFYDVYILRLLQSSNIDYVLLSKALEATAAKRKSNMLVENAEKELDKILVNTELIQLWNNYRKKFNYAADIEWDEIALSLRELYFAVKTG